MPNKILLDIKDLDVYYGGIHALHRINMVVEQGEIVSIIGANGAGNLRCSTRSQEIRTRKTVP